MAYQDITAPAEVLNREITMTRNALAAVGGFFVRVNAWMIENSAANARLKTVRRLQAKTDAQLAEMKLRREDIVAHVFSDVFYI